MTARLLGLTAVAVAAGCGLILAVTTAAGTLLDVRRVRTEQFDHDWDALPALRRESFDLVSDVSLRRSLGFEDVA